MSQPTTIILVSSPPPPTINRSQSENSNLKSSNSYDGDEKNSVSSTSITTIKRKRDAELSKPSVEVPRFTPSRDDDLPQIIVSKSKGSNTVDISTAYPQKKYIGGTVIIDGDDDLEDQDEENSKSIGDDVERDELDSDEDEDDEKDEDRKYALHIEVRLGPNSTILYDTVRRSIGHFIHDNFTSIETSSPVPGWQEIKILEGEVQSVYCAECAYHLALVPIDLVRLHIHVYEVPPEGKDKMSALLVNSQDPSDLENDSGDEAHEGDVAASRLELPAHRLEGIWESLIYEEGLKTKLLNYIHSSIVFADKKVDQSLIAWHRLILLHGPPGTGKTSLCQALAQKISIRLSEIYHKTELVEINSHSLFSKWFSESGKLVQSLFTKIEQMAEELDVFVLVLIDEVESLAGSRSSGASGNEPSDALRAVNALLTALDKLRHHHNVLVLTTSNLTNSIDDAFLDRADLAQYIGLPSSEATYWILRTCLKELVKTGIVKTRDILEYKEAMLIRDGLNDQRSAGTESNKNILSTTKASKATALHKSQQCSIKLLEITELAAGMSGRSLRRLPLLAHAKASVTGWKIGMEAYLVAMLQTVKEQKAKAPSNSFESCLNKIHKENYKDNFKKIRKLQKTKEVNTNEKLQHQCEKYDDLNILKPEKKVLTIAESHKEASEGEIEPNERNQQMLQEKSTQQVEKAQEHVQQEESVGQVERAETEDLAVEREELEIQEKSEGTAPVEKFKDLAKESREQSQKHAEAQGKSEEQVQEAEQEKSKAQAAQEHPEERITQVELETDEPEKHIEQIDLELEKLQQPKESITQVELELDGPEEAEEHLVVELEPAKYTAQVELELEGSQEQIDQVELEPEESDQPEEPIQPVQLELDVPEEPQEHMEVELEPTEYSAQVELEQGQSEEHTGQLEPEPEGFQESEEHLQQAELELEKHTTQAQLEPDEPDTLEEQVEEEQPEEQADHEELEERTDETAELVELEELELEEPAEQEQEALAEHVEEQEILEKQAQSESEQAEETIEQLKVETKPFRNPYQKTESVDKTNKTRLTLAKLQRDLAKLNEGERILTSHTIERIDEATKKWIEVGREAAEYLWNLVGKDALSKQGNIGTELNIGWGFDNKSYFTNYNQVEAKNERESLLSFEEDDKELPSVEEIVGEFSNLRRYDVHGLSSINQRSLQLENNAQSPNLEERSSELKIEKNVGWMMEQMGLNPLLFGWNNDEQDWK
ncbi:hypothetical protein O181_027424 [Austropuccinia psidii MF-1]|uniref:AAA+ ATPase domain-containing protein n=1 Tax=Austropuccinia psidii MF-1 TaxID=1389203 RepID=A0A9Q3CLZ8_9BASI|nr:hypothetical protein [Austropuccinia psidii MF-1]